MKDKSTAAVRQAFLDYFKSKGHEVVASSALIPTNDPTLLFTNAGMVQFKDVFVGAEKRSYSRASTCQKCLRISGKHNDFENVGVTARHHTFFEMLGNFSFGDYFKTDAIAYGWEFVTKVLGLPKDRLWVTVFENDDEAADIWAKTTDVLPGRIIRLGEKDNFWAMGETGPCGPCSEIHYYIGDNVAGQSAEDFLKDDGSYLEIWNLVFMQFERHSDGSQTALPRPSIDTGMGLERVASILQGRHANYESDTLRSLIACCEELSGFKYDGSSYQRRDLKTDINYARDVAMRVIADHSRAVTFLVAEGLTPGSEGRSYVLRRILRRAIRHGRVLQFKEPFLARVCERVISEMKAVYPEIAEHREMIMRVVDAEERKFYETLDSGLSILNKAVEDLPSGKPFPGETAFLLHDTYGFPLDLTQDALKTWSLEVDLKAYENAMQAQRDRSREDRKSQALVFQSSRFEGAPTEFLGYRSLQAEARLLQISAENESQKSFKTGDQVSLLFSATPFYAESGGQVGDTGIVEIAGTRLSVLDTQKAQDKFFVHICRVEEGELSHEMLGKNASLSVDALRRSRIRANHSSTHLFHSALRSVLGKHVKQSGSRVDENTLRFDYSHFEAVSDDQLRDIQAMVNQQIRENHEAIERQMPIDEARKSGAMALFGEKYGDIVRVIQIGPHSIELCGGTHVSRSGDIGFVMIASEGSISAGARRIECWSGYSAELQLMRERKDREQIASMLKTDGSELGEKVEKALLRSKALEKEIETLKARLASSASSSLADQARISASGIKVIAEIVPSSDANTLRSMVDTLRVKLGSGVVALASEQDNKGILVAGVTSDLTGRISAGNLVKEASLVAGGRGGGKPDFAQAGGLDKNMLPQSLKKLLEMIG